MVPGKAKKDLSVDPLVPACPGCTRVNRLRDLDRDRLHEANVFVTGAGSRQLEQFYHQAMTARGWSRRISNAPLGQVQQNVSFQGNETTVLSFYRPEAGDHRILTLLIYPIGQGQTAVHTTLSQSAHLATESE